MIPKDPYDMEYQILRDHRNPVRNCSPALIAKGFSLPPAIRPNSGNLSTWRHMGGPD